MVLFIYYGILSDYTCWTLHEEDNSDSSDEEGSDQGVEDEEHDETNVMLHEIQKCVTSGLGESDDRNENDHVINDTTYHGNFSRIIHDSKQELFPGCKRFSKLEFMIHLLHIKTLCGWSEKSFGMLFQLLKMTFDLGDDFPKNCYEAKKYRKDLGLGYENIDACKNDCILYQKEYQNYSKCLMCDCVRWKDEEKKIPFKFLHHFPLITRLQRLFMSSKTTAHMR